MGTREIYSHVALVEDIFKLNRYCNTSTHSQFEWWHTEALVTCLPKFARRLSVEL